MVEFVQPWIEVFHWVWGLPIWRMSYGKVNFWLSMCSLSFSKRVPFSKAIQCEWKYGSGQGPLCQGQGHLCRLRISGVSSVCVVVHGALNLPCWPSLRADWARHVQQIWLSCHRIRFAGVRDLQLQKLKGASARVDWTNMHLHFLT